MKLTVEWLEQKGACEEGIEWFKRRKDKSLAGVLKAVRREKEWGYAGWFIENILTKKQAVRVAVFSARLCLPEFEKEFPDDNRPRKAIEAAEAYIKNPCKKTIEAAESTAAWSAAWSAESAARSAARSAAWSAESAAWLAAKSAESAARSAARSAAWSKIVGKMIEVVS